MNRPTAPIQQAALCLLYVSNVRVVTSCLALKTTMAAAAATTTAAAEKSTKERLLSVLDDLEVLSR